MITINIGTPEHITEKLRINLQQFESNENRNLFELEKSVGLCSSALLELRAYVDGHDFRTREEEILFLSHQTLCAHKIPLLFKDSSTGGKVP